MLGRGGEKKRISLWKLGLTAWPIAFVMFAALEYYLSTHQKGHPGTIDWLFVVLMAFGPTGLLVMLVEHIQAQPTPDQEAALSAIFAAGSGTIGAVVVTRNGVPEVIATVRSVEEYMELAGSGQLPHDHRVYLPDDT